MRVPSKVSRGLGVRGPSSDSFERLWASRLMVEGASEGSGMLSVRVKRFRVEGLGV